MTISRRHLLAASPALCAGFPSLAMSAMDSLAPRATHHVARAKRVIFLFMHGGPSQVDTFDYKPELQASDGKTLPFDAAKHLEAGSTLMKSPWRFAKRGDSGLWVSDLLPHTAKQIDELCVVRSMHSRGQSHGQAVCMLHTGSDNLVRPSLGAWVSYGLGSENPNLPSFVAISPASGHGGPRNYGTAFLPAIHQGSTIGRNGKLGDAQLANLNSDQAPADQREQLDLLQAMNRDHLRRAVQDKQITGAIESLELAYRMQREAPGVMDLSAEPQHIQKMYGIDQKATANFGRQCLLARRLAEAGVRFIELSTGNAWDQHSKLVEGHTKNALATDQPIAALLSDLRSRGMLDDTLVVWTGEFGRTPIVQGKPGKNAGRDHNPQGFTTWLAGGGVRPGMAYGNTDEFGYYAVEDRVHMHDLHATILHQLGLDHEGLTYRYAGRDFRLTDVAGRVVNALLS